MAYYENYLPDENGVLHKVVINAGVGFVLPFYGETAPPGTLACDGSEISRAAYDELFAVLGTKAGAGDGVSTFNLPDLRGQFVRGTGGNAAALGTVQSDAIRNITGGFSLRAYGYGDNPIGENMFGLDNIFYNRSDTGQADTVAGNAGTTRSQQSVGFNASYAVPTANENRPTNVALLWCIIYE